MSLESEMLAHIHAGLTQHDRTCPMPAKAILLNPGNYELFGWDEIMGIAVIPDSRVQPKRFRIDCDGSAFGLEEAIEELTQTPAAEPIEIPVGPARENEPTFFKAKR